MKCDICGKQADPSETVAGSKLCNSCFSMVYDEHGDSASVNTVGCATTCSSCQKPVYSYYQKEGNTLCGSCFEGRMDATLEEATQKASKFYTPPELLPIPGFSWFGLTRKRLEFLIWCLGIFYIIFIYLLTLISQFGFGFYINIALPLLPFICLALICRFAKEASSQAIIGALAAVLLWDNFIISWITYELKYAHRVGANIGVGLALLYMPFLLFAVMTVGSLLGSMLLPRNKERHT